MYIVGDKLGVQTLENTTMWGSARARCRIPGTCALHNATLGFAGKRRHHDPALPFEMQLLLALQYLSTFDAVLLYARKTFTPR